jgi:methylamine--corrinoid protein Co-methyltransferase
MLSLLDIAERAQKGPKVDEKDWDMGLFRTMEELGKKYQIAYPGKGLWFNTDTGLVDRVFEAALEFLTRKGVYCVSTGRVIEVTREEILQAIREAPTQVLMGEGRDQRVFKQHAIEGTAPLNFCPGHHAPFTEELAALVVKNFAQIPRTDFLEGFNMPAVDGREIFGMPMEVYATRRQMGWMREGIRKAGRPGLALVYYPINTRAAVLLAALDPGAGLRPTDGVLLSALPDVKVEHDLLAMALVCQEYGCFGLSGSFALAGGFCGEVEGAIIEGVCKPLAAMLCYHDWIHYTGVEHVQALSALKIMLQPLNWARSVVNQVLNSKTHTICMAWVIPTSGSGTETGLIENAIRSIEAPLNGASLYAVRCSRAQMNAGQTPLEAEWMLEVADATQRAGLTRETATPILWALAEKLKGRVPEEGAPIQECYDLVNHRPRPAYEKIYLSVKAELARLGLAFA